MPKGMLYKWESNNRGLDHKCGTCKTVLSNPRARKTCFGIHEEVCPKYHKTLFFVGTSHKCDACRKSRELHEKRHRDIALLVKKILEVDALSGHFEGGLPIRKQKARENDGVNVLDLNPEADQSLDENEDWADASTVVEDEKEIETQESADIKKIKRKQLGRKHLKSQNKFQSTVQNLQFVEEALHPAPNPLLDKTNQTKNNTDLKNNLTIDTNIAFHPHLFRYSSLRPALHEKRAARLNGIVPESVSVDDSHMNAILHALGIRNSATSSSTKARKALLVRLRNAIVHDLCCIENEEKETMARMAGYWRYAHRHTYNSMVRNNEIWDWASGAKLEETDEEESDFGINENDNEDDDTFIHFSELDIDVGSETLHDEISESNSKLDSSKHRNVTTEVGLTVEQRGTKRYPPIYSDVDDKRTLGTRPLVHTPYAARVKQDPSSPWAGVKDTRGSPRKAPLPSPRPAHNLISPIPQRVLDLSQELSHSTCSLGTLTPVPSTLRPLCGGKPNTRGHFCKNSDKSVRLPVRRGERDCAERSAERELAEREAVRELTEREAVRELTEREAVRDLAEREADDGKGVWMIVGKNGKGIPVQDDAEKVK